MASQERSRYSMLIQWSDEDEAYVVSFPEWNAAGHLAHTHGATYEAAAAKGEAMLAFIVNSARHDSDPIPAPQSFPSESTDDVDVASLTSAHA
jgi:predicted RNase H-like HicB family nuclease